MTGKDPWSRSLLDTPSPPPLDDDDGYLADLISFCHDTDLTAELDLSRRDDRAVVRETPFTLAKLRSKTKDKIPGGSQTDDNRPRGNIVTAEDATRPGYRKASPIGKGATDWKNTSAWSTANGEPIPYSALPPRKGIEIKHQGTTTKVVNKAHVPVSRAPAKKPLPPKGTTTKAKAKPKAAPAAKKGKGKKASDDKIEFRRLPAEMSSNLDFPIVAGLERQKTLPLKSTRKRPAPTDLSPEPRQSTLDVNLLVTGGIKRQVKKAKTATMSYPTMASTNQSTSDRGIAHKEETNSDERGGREDRGEVCEEPPALILSGSTDPLPHLHTPTNSVEVMSDDQPIFVAHSEPVMKTPKPTSAYGHVLSPPPSSESPALVGPRQVPPATVMQLEEMVENGFELSPPSAVRMPQSPVYEQYHSPPPTLASQTPHSYTRQNSSSTQYTVPSTLRSARVAQSQASQVTPKSSASAQSTGRSVWGSLLSKPPISTTDAEWSTLPQRRGRLTIRPGSAAPRRATIAKSATFHLPMDTFTHPNRGPTQQRNPHASSGYHAQRHDGDQELSLSPEPASTFKITTWAPTPLKHESPGSINTPTRYVPPHVRVLEQAAHQATRSPHRSPDHYHQDMGGSGYHDQVAGSNQTLIPIDDDEPEDWAAAWGRSANIASRR